MTTLVSTAHADTNETQYCAITTSGSAECFYQFTDASYETLTIAVVNSDGEVVSEPISETIHGNLLYTATAPNDVTITSDGTVYSVIASDEGAWQSIKTTTNDDGDTVMSGTHTDSYRAFAASGSKFAFDSVNEYFGFMDTASGVTATDIDGTYLASKVIPGATAYTKIKNTTFEKVYFGVEELLEDEGHIYVFIDSENILDREFVPTDNIQFIASGNIDNSGVQLTHKKTISFDINSEGHALIVYQDIAGNFRIRASDDSTMFGGATPIAISNATTTTPDFKDIHFLRVLWSSVIFVLRVVARS